MNEEKKLNRGTTKETLSSFGVLYAVIAPVVYFASSAIGWVA